MSPEPQNLTELVNLWKRGDHAAGDAVFAAVQGRLRKVANKLLYKRGGYQRLQATELVNEAYFRMANERKEDCLNRDEFIRIAVRLIDRTILDAMRYDRAGNRDFRVEIQDEQIQAGQLNGAVSYDAENLLLEIDHLDKALESLEKESSLAHEVLVRKIFNDETLRSISHDLNISEDTAGRKWTFARAFLATHLAEQRRPAQA